MAPNDRTFPVVAASSGGVEGVVGMTPIIGVADRALTTEPGMVKTQGRIMTERSFEESLYPKGKNREKQSTAGRYSRRENPQGVNPKRLDSVAIATIDKSYQDIFVV